MKRLLLFLIERATPASDREWVIGDTLEEFDRVAQSGGRRAAVRWLIGETWRVAVDAPMHRRAVRHHGYALPRRTSDRPLGVVVQDLRYGWRLLRRSPGFAAVAILTLAVGIGANTAMFAVVNAVLFKPLPFPDAARLMLVHVTHPDPRNPGVTLDIVWSYPKYQTFLDAQSVFDDTALFAGRDVSLSGEREPEWVRGEVITERYLDVLGIEPVLGRGFSRDEAQTPGTTPVALIGRGLWSRRFGADPAVVGTVVQINGTPYTIVGVLPQGFRGLNGDAQIWLPIGAFEPAQLAATAAQSHSYRLVARRRPDVTEAAALAATIVAGARVDAAHRDTFTQASWGATAVSLDASRADADVRRGSLMLLAAVGCVLLIACVNLTNLVGMRAAARRREVGVRLAIGATRFRIVRQFLAESLLLSGLGAAAGILLAGMLLQAAGLLLPSADVFFETSIAPGTSRTPGAAGLTRVSAATIGLDAVTLWFAVGLSLVTAVLVSLMPALRVSVLRPGLVLKAGARLAGEGLRTLGTRSLLVSAQIALALILLAGAGLMLGSVARLHATSIGVTADRVLTLRIDLPRTRYDATTGGLFFQQLRERVGALSGVEAVALGSCPPVSGGCNETILWHPPGQPLGGGRDPLVGIYWATPELLPALDIQLRSGRNFTALDRAGQPPVVLINEAAARTLWPNESPLGRRIAVGQGGMRNGAEIVGVVADVHYDAIDVAPAPAVYVSLAQSFQPRMRLFVRSRLAPDVAVNAITRELHALDRTLPVGDVKTMDERVEDAMWRTRVGAWLLSTFAVLALVLTAIGVFGAMAQTVAQYTTDIGIRIALGAQRRDVLALVLGRATLVTGLGLGAGTLSALALTRVLTALLYGVQAHDPPTLSPLPACSGRWPCSPATSLPAAPPASTPSRRCAPNRRAPPGGLLATPGSGSCRHHPRLPPRPAARRQRTLYHRVSSQSRCGHRARRAPGDVLSR